MSVFVACRNFDVNSSMLGSSAPSAAPHALTNILKHTQNIDGAPRYRTRRHFIKFPLFNIINRKIIYCQNSGVDAFIEKREVKHIWDFRYHFYYFICVIFDWFRLVFRAYVHGSVITCHVVIFFVQHYHAHCQQNIFKSIF